MTESDFMSLMIMKLVAFVGVIAVVCILFIAADRQANRIHQHHLDHHCDQVELSEAR